MDQCLSFQTSRTYHLQTQIKDINCSRIHFLIELLNIIRDRHRLHFVVKRIQGYFDQVIELQLVFTNTFYFQFILSFLDRGIRF